MRDLLTTISSIIIILSCLSLLIVSGESGGADSGETTSNPKRLAGTQNVKQPAFKTTLFKKVQSVNFKKGILKFTTLEEGGFKEYYFQTRGKNVILSKNTNGEIPINSIKFIDVGNNTLVVTIPPEFEINFMEAMSASY